MKTKQSHCRIGGAILVFSLLFGVGIVLSTTAQAQYPNERNTQDRDRNDDGNRRGRNWDRYGNYGGSDNLRQTALNAGYSEGRRLGRVDRNKRNRSDYHNHGIYRNATKDYNRRLGDREIYRRYFREAFDAGYNAEGYAANRRGDDRYRNQDGNNGNQNRRGRNWDAYGNFGGSFQLRQTALNAGYNQGIKQGQDDRNDRSSNGYQNRSEYRDATKDYSSDLGDRELYRRYFREAYQTGHNDGLNGH